MTPRQKAALTGMTILSLAGICFYGFFSQAPEDTVKMSRENMVFAGGFISTITWGIKMICDIRREIQEEDNLMNWVDRVEQQQNERGIV